VGVGKEEVEGEIVTAVRHRLVEAVQRGARFEPCGVVRDAGVQQRAGKEVE